MIEFGILEVLLLCFVVYVLGICCGSWLAATDDELKELDL